MFRRCMNIVRLLFTHLSIHLDGESIHMLMDRHKTERSDMKPQTD